MALYKKLTVWYTNSVKRSTYAFTKTLALSPAYKTLCSYCALWLNKYRGIKKNNNGNRQKTAMD